MLNEVNSVTDDCVCNLNPIFVGRGQSKVSVCYRAERDKRAGTPVLHRSERKIPSGSPELNTGIDVSATRKHCNAQSAVVAACQHCHQFVFRKLDFRSDKHVVADRINIYARTVIRYARRHGKRVVFAESRSGTVADIPDRTEQIVRFVANERAVLYGEVSTRRSRAGNKFGFDRINAGFYVRGGKSAVRDDTRVNDGRIFLVREGHFNAVESEFFGFVDIDAVCAFRFSVGVNHRRNVLDYAEVVFGNEFGSWRIGSRHSGNVERNAGNIAAHFTFEKLYEAVVARLCVSGDYATLTIHDESNAVIRSCVIDNARVFRLISFERETYRGIIAPHCEVILTAHFKSGIERLFASVIEYRAKYRVVRVDVRILARRREQMVGKSKEIFEREVLAEVKSGYRGQAVARKRRVHGHSVRA